MKIVKKAGKTSWQSRRRTMHGSTGEWRLQQLNGKDLRDDAKPGQRGRRSRRPAR